MSASTTGNIMNAVENATRILLGSKGSNLIVDRLTLTVLTLVAEERLARESNG